MNANIEDAVFAFIRVNSRLALAACWFCAFALSAADTVLELSPSKTEIGFTVSDTLHTVHGTFKLKRGSIRFDPETGKAAGEIVIDVPSGASGSGMRDKRMHKEILESQKYPEAAFIPDKLDGRLAAQGPSEVDVHGTFRIHGADHEFTLHFNVVAAEGDRYTAATHFSIPYVQWGMKNPSNFLLKVGDRVEMEIKTVLTR
jgi:polyisoprenoid-binding protein YceI